MSINYYFIDKEKAEENKQICSNFNCIDSLYEEFIKTDLFEGNENELQWKIDDFKNDILSLVEKPVYSIHIFQNAFGWETLFQVNREFSNYEELKQFYDTNKSNLTIIDEYDRELTWLDLLDQIRKEGKNRGDYYDKYGCAWMNAEFS